MSEYGIRAVDVGWAAVRGGLMWLVMLLAGLFAVQRRWTPITSKQLWTAIVCSVVAAFLLPTLLLLSASFKVVIQAHHVHLVLLRRWVLARHHLRELEAVSFSSPIWAASLVFKDGARIHIPALHSSQRSILVRDIKLLRPAVRIHGAR